MKKIIVYIISFILLCVLSFALFDSIGKIKLKGSANDVRISLGESLYTENELKHIANIIIDDFKKNYPADLVYLAYTEDINLNNELALLYGYDEAIRFYGSFKTYNSFLTENSNFIPNEHYNWSWVLGKNIEGDWQIITCGV